MRKSVLAFYILCFGAIAMAQSEVRFEELYSINSLSQNSVISIHQDKLGFLWIGTFDGLNKYDGYKYRTYRLSEDSASNAKINRVMSIEEDQNGKIWIETYDGRIHRFDPAKERFLSFPVEEAIWYDGLFTDFHETDDGVVCLSTKSLGAYLVSYDSLTYQTNILHFFNRPDGVPDFLTNNSVFFVRKDPKGYFWIGTSNGLNRINSADINNPELKPEKMFYTEQNSDSNKISFLNAVLLDDKMWFGTKNSGLFCYNIESEEFVDIDVYKEYAALKNFRITALETSGKDLWIGTDKGVILRYNSHLDKFSQLALEDQASGKTVKSIYVDYFNSLWILTENFGISRLDSETGKSYYYPLTPPEIRNLTDDELVRIYEDSENNFWLGGQNMGLLQYQRKEDRFKAYVNDPKDPTSLPSNTLECLTEDREGNLLIGTNWFGKGLCRMITIDPAFQYIRPFKFPLHKMENNIRSLLIDSRNYIWAGTKFGEIYIYNSDFQKVHVINRFSSEGFAGSNAYTIYEDPDHYIWIGTKGKGIFRTKKPLDEISPDYQTIDLIEINYIHEEDNQATHKNIYDLVMDDFGRIWAATYGSGVFLIDQNAKNTKLNSRQFNTQNSRLNSDRVRDLHIDRKGKLWLATSYGVNYIDIYKDKELKIHNLQSDSTKKGNLSYNVVNMITEDRRGNIWLATAGGGVNVIENSSDNNLSIRQYTTRNGLNANYTISLLEDIYGYIWIGTENGISRINPLNHLVENFNKRNGLPETLFSEHTCAAGADGKIMFGTVNGFYSITPNLLTQERFRANINLTELLIHNREVTPRQADSPLEQSISYTRKLTLKSKQSNFSIEFSMLSFKSPEHNQYEYFLDGFDKQWIHSGSEHRATYTNVPPGNYTFRVRGLYSDLSEFNSEKRLQIRILPPFYKTTLAFFIYLLIVSGILVLGYRIVARITKLKYNLRVEHGVAESKLRFFTNVSHEFRTPLTLILGPIEQLLSRTDFNTGVKQQLGLVHRNSQRLLRMVNQLLDFRKVQNEKMNLEVQRIELIPFLQQIYDSFNGLAKQKNIRFDLINEYDDIVLWGDVQKLDIVIFNLLSNAFKFTPDNNSISIIVKEVSDEKEWIHIIIKDSGIGIEGDKLKDIFNRYFVHHNPKDASQYGTGIGLSLSMEYINLHKGQILVNSTVEEGSEFIVKLLLGKNHFSEDSILGEQVAYSYSPKITYAEDIATNKKQVETGKQHSELFSVLVVEDDMEMSKYLRSILEDKYDVFLAKDGMDGLEKANEHNPNLIVSDIIMPKMNGIEMTKKLKESFVTSHIPIIILSSKTEVESQVEGLDIGAEAYVSKPFNSKLLLSYIQSFISQREKLKKSLGSTVELKPSEISVTPRDKIFFEEVLRIIDEHLTDSEFSVEKLAESMLVSRTLFYTKIKGITGYQPVELIRMIRMKRASNLLLSEEYNVSEVAYMVGYKDIRYFSTSFKKHFGISPSRYAIDNG